MGAAYLFFLGLTAGAFLITILTYVFRVKIFAPIGPLSAFTVLVAITCEVIIISFDLGHFSRVWRFLVNPGWTSMIFWMVVFTNAMIVIYALESCFLLRESLVEGAQKDTVSARKLSEWAELAGVRASDLEDLAREFTSHGKKGGGGH